MSAGIVKILCSFKLTVYISVVSQRAMIYSWKALCIVLGFCLLLIVPVYNISMQNAAALHVPQAKLENFLPLMKEQFECNSSFCQNVICRPIMECVNGEQILNGSLCGCCAKCVLRQNENQACDDDFKAPMDGAPERKCKIGLTCVHGICTKADNTGSCETIAKRRKSLKNDSSLKISFSKDLWIPECDEAGWFKAKQCKAKKCLCVDKIGHALFGQEEKDLSENMTCSCSRAMKALEDSNPDRWMVKTQEHCTSTGDYKTLQCIYGLCYCTDSTSGKVYGRVVTKHLRMLLPCYDSIKMERRYETQCDLQLMRTRSLRYQFYRKNILIAGLEYEQCDLDGTFGAKQCLTDKCVCTDRKGIGIKSYKIEKIARKEELMMKCNCARDEHDSEILHARYPKMVCEGNGNFQPLQCFGIENCYCVDKDGDIITEKLIHEFATATYCTEVQKQLQK